MIKVHVHSNSPGKVLQMALRLGELDKLKIENMREQNRELMAERKKNEKEFGLLAVSTGTGIDELFQALAVDALISGGQTMNPSIDSIASAINKINARNVFVLPNNSNIILAAQQASELTQKGVVLIPSKVEKAGIIKPGRPVITAADDGPAFETIARRALQLGSPCVRVGREAAERAPLDRLELPLRGAHQKLNAALALATVDCLRDTLRVSREAMISGLLKVNWAGRCQLEKTASGQLVLLDGAHNPAGAETLRATLEQHFPGRRPTLILGVLKDKDWHAMCRVLAPVAGRLLLVPVPSERTTTPEMLRLACQEVNPAIETRACHSLAEALAESRQDSLVALAGSLFLVGEAMELMKLAPDENPGERGLNEWNAVPAAHERLR